MGTDSASVINIVSLIFLVASSSFLGLLTFLMLKSSARPRLRVTVSPKDGGEKGKLIFHKGQTCTLRFYLENVGHWYRAKPAARDVTLWVNFESALEPLVIRYGSNLQNIERGFQIGKGGSKYVKATGINLFQEELGEAMEVDVKMPEEKKKEYYDFWVAAYANEGGCGVHKFQLTIID